MLTQYKACKYMKRLVCLLTVCLIGVLTLLARGSAQVSSPDRQLTITFELTQGKPYYKIITVR